MKHFQEKFAGFRTLGPLKPRLRECLLVSFSSPDDVDSFAEHRTVAKGAVVCISGPSVPGIGSPLGLQEGSVC